MEFNSKWNFVTLVNLSELRCFTGHFNSHTQFFFNVLHNCKLCTKVKDSDNKLINIIGQVEAIAIYL